MKVQQLGRLVIGMPLACLSLQVAKTHTNVLPSHLFITGFTISVLHSPRVLVNPNNPVCTALKAEYCTLLISLYDFIQ